MLFILEPRSWTIGDLGSSMKVARKILEFFYPRSPHCKTTSHTKHKYCICIAPPSVRTSLMNGPFAILPFVTGPSNMNFKQSYAMCGISLSSLELILFFTYPPPYCPHMHGLATSFYNVTQPLTRIAAAAMCSVTAGELCSRAGVKANIAARGIFHG